MRPSAACFGTSIPASFVIVSAVYGQVLGAIPGCGGVDGKDLRRSFDCPSGKSAVQE